MEEILPRTHEFVEAYFPKPTLCRICHNYIWGVFRPKAYHCYHCGYSCHIKCYEKAGNENCVKYTQNYELLASPSPSKEAVCTPLHYYGYLKKQTVMRSKNANPRSNQSPFKERMFRLYHQVLFFYLPQKTQVFKGDFELSFDKSEKNENNQNLLPQQTLYLFRLEFAVGKFHSIALDSLNNADNLKAVLSSSDQKTRYKGWAFIERPSNKTWDHCIVSLKMMPPVLKIKWMHERGFFPLKNAKIQTLSDNGLLISLVSTLGAINLQFKNEKEKEKWIDCIYFSIHSTNITESEPGSDDELLNNDEGIKDNNVSSKVELFDRDAIVLMNSVKNALEEESLHQRQKTESTTSTPPNPAGKSSICILSLDGGGIRGIMTCIILQRLEKTFPDLLERVDFVAGTSNGAIIASIIALGNSLSLARVLTEITGKMIFKKSANFGFHRSKFYPHYRKMIFDEVFQNKTLSDVKKKILIPAFLLDNEHPKPECRSCQVEYFHNFEEHLPIEEDEPETDILELDNQNHYDPNIDGIEVPIELSSPKEPKQLHCFSPLPSPIIPVPILASESPLIPSKLVKIENDIETHISTQTNEKKSKDENDLKSKIHDDQHELSKSQHLPSVSNLNLTQERSQNSGFCSKLNTGNVNISDIIMRTTAAPTYFPSHQKYIDGGIFSQDPSSDALTMALSPNKMCKSPNEICLLSIGTGVVNRVYLDDSSTPHDWGYYQWLPKLPNLMWDAMVLKSEAFCSEILRDRYFRINPQLEKDAPMDDIDQIPYLISVAEALDLSDTIKWIRKFFY